MFVFIKKMLFTGSAFISSLVSATTLDRKSEDKCSSCILSIMLFSIVFTACIDIHCVYYEYASSNKETISINHYDYQAKI